jgi:hypothetical protein
MVSSLRRCEKGFFLGPFHIHEELDRAGAAGVEGPAADGAIGGVDFGGGPSAVAAEHNPAGPAPLGQGRRVALPVAELLPGPAADSRRGMYEVGSGDDRQ